MTMPTAISAVAKPSHGPRGKRRKRARTPSRRTGTVVSGAVIGRSIRRGSCVPDRPCNRARSFPHRAEGDAAEEVLPEQDRKDEDRDEEQRRSSGDGRPVLAALADDEGNERRQR